MNVSAKAYDSIRSSGLGVGCWVLGIANNQDKHHGQRHSTFGGVKGCRCITNNTEHGTRRYTRTHCSTVCSDCPHLGRHRSRTSYGSISRRIERFPSPSPGTCINDLSLDQSPTLSICFLPSFLPSPLAMNKLNS